MDIEPTRLAAWRLATQELADVAAALDETSYDAFARHFDQLGITGRGFFTGQGRSGLIAQMAAMRFMHLGAKAHMVGEATAPSISAGDALVVISGSGATPVSLSFAGIAQRAGAAVLAVTTQPDSPLARLADAALCLPIGSHLQFGGTVFEQSSLILLDSIVLDQMRIRGVPAETMGTNHTTFQ
ncbi:MAG: SIS domain-containing protein [Arachnia sp.]